MAKPNQNMPREYWLRYVNVWRKQMSLLSLWNSPDKMCCLDANYDVLRVRYSASMLVTVDRCLWVTI